VNPNTLTALRDEKCFPLTFEAKSSSTYTSGSWDRPASNVGIFEDITTKPLILGVGNLLMGDEGVGIVAIRRLEQTSVATRADLVDGGTGGFHLLGYFRDRQHLILIDAAADGQPIGTVSRIRPRYASDFPTSLTAHDIGLKDLLESAALLGDLPEVDLITISVGGIGSLTMELSPFVAAAIPQVEKLVRQCLESS